MELGCLALAWQLIGVFLLGSCQLYALDSFLLKIIKPPALSVMTKIFKKCEPCKWLSNVCLSQQTAWNTDLGSSSFFVYLTEVGTLKPNEDYFKFQHITSQVDQSMARKKDNDIMKPSQLTPNNISFWHLWHWQTLREHLSHPHNTWTFSWMIRWLDSVFANKAAKEMGLVVRGPASCFRQASMAALSSLCCSSLLSHRQRGGASKMELDMNQDPKVGIQIPGWNVKVSLFVRLLKMIQQSWKTQKEPMIPMKRHLLPWKVVSLGKLEILL